LIIRRTPDDGHRYRPAVFRQIENFRGTLYNEARNLAHPLALASISWRGFENAVDRAITDFESLRTADAKPGSTAFTATLESYAALLANGVEFSDTISRAVAECFLPAHEKPNIPLVNRDRRHMAMISNKPKHNQNFFAPVMGTADDGRKVFGFSVYEITAKGMQVPNRQIHDKAEAFSLALEIKRTVATVFVIAERVADFISQRGDLNDGVALQLNDSDIARMRLLGRVSELPACRFPFERGDVPGIEFIGSVMTVRSSGGTAQRLPNRIAMSLAATPYTGALSIKVPL
jgi:hypothetical protein